MSTYLFFGKYSLDSIKAISADRTTAAEKVISDHGGSVLGGYALLGETDLVLIVELPDNEKAMQTSAALSSLLGISFTTYPAVGIEQFDRLMS